MNLEKKSRSWLRNQLDRKGKRGKEKTSLPCPSEGMYRKGGGKWEPFSDTLLRKEKRGRKVCWFLDHSRERKAEDLQGGRGGSQET